MRNPLFYRGFNVQGSQELAQIARVSGFPEGITEGARPLLVCYYVLRRFLILNGRGRRWLIGLT
jgi:hypothetical protein